MIDWINLSGNTLWILGLALGLSTLSLAVWQATFTGISLRTIFGSRVFQVYGSLAEILFCLGLAVITNSWLERGLWFLLSVVVFGLWIIDARNNR